MRRKINKILLSSLITFSALNTTSVKAAEPVDFDKIQIPALHEVKVPDVKKVTLKNGMRLYILEDHKLPLLDISARINIGSFLDPKDQIGLSDITGDLLREAGTEKYSPDELDELLAGIGANVNTYGDITFSHLSLNMLSKQKELAVELLEQILRKPRFDEERFNQRKVAYKSSISRRNDSPSSVANREFDKMIYGKDSVYAPQIEYSHINNIKRQDLVNFHKKYYKPEFVMLSICGDFKTDEMIALIEKHFNDWERGNEKLPALPEVKYNFDQQVGHIQFDNAKQANIYFGHIGGRSYDEDEPQRIVLNSILGGGFGSKYFDEVRSKAGLCYNIYGTYDSNFSYPGEFINFTSTNCNTAIKATNLMIDIIKRIKEKGVTEEELKKGKEPYLNRFVFNFSSKAAIVSRMLNYDLFGLPADFLQKQKKAVEATTAEDVKRVANKYLKEDKLRIIIAGDKKLYDASLESLNNGKVQEIDISIPADK